MSKKDQPNQPRMITGILQSQVESLAEKFNASVSFDHILATDDIHGSIAHATMLGASNIVPQEETQKIIAGLKAIEQEIEQNTFEWKVSLEDVHMNIESRLTESIGFSGKKLHTARSRNDQVATTIRLYLRRSIVEIITKGVKLAENLLTLAQKHTETIMPGFTHLQSAQPVTFGHHICAWVAMLERDLDRLKDCHDRMNVSPLGAAALAGSTFPVNPQMTSDLLNFKEPFLNSLDAVSDRDFIMEFQSCCSIMMIHFSRWCEELILWSSSQFGFISLPDGYCTGSSIMPQKKNPDLPELIRGKSGRVVGNLISILMLMKSQPLAYNKDNQEDKEPLFDSIETAGNCIEILAAMVDGIDVNKDAMAFSAKKGFSIATDLADDLVRKGLSFREAHSIAGHCVRLCIKKGKEIDQLSPAEIKGIIEDNLQNLEVTPSFSQDEIHQFSVENAVSRRNHRGGTAPDAVTSSIAQFRNKLKIFSQITSNSKP